jgi:hypothetical protein
MKKVIKKANTTSSNASNKKAAVVPFTEKVKEVAAKDGKPYSFLELIKQQGCLITGNNQRGGKRERSTYRNDIFPTSEQVPDARRKASIERKVRQTAVKNMTAYAQLYAEGSPISWKAFEAFRKSFYQDTAHVWYEGSDDVTRSLIEKLKAYYELNQSTLLA